MKFAQPFERLVTSFYKKLFYCDSAIRDVFFWKKIQNPTAYCPFSFDSSLYTRFKHHDGSVLRIGYLGRLSEEKGLRNLLQVFQELQNESKFPVELIIAGNGPLKNLFQEKAGIHFIGTIPHNKADLFYQQIDIFVLPSLTTPFWKEQFGRVIIESVASGIPVIGSSSGAIPEVLTKIGLKTIFEEGNNISLKQTITDLWKAMNSENWNEQMERYFQNNKQFSHIAVSQRIYNEITG